VIAGTFLFAAVRRIFRSDIAAAAAAILFGLNPNMMYLQSNPMSEPFFYVALMGMLYFSVLFRENQAWWTAAAAGVACCAGTLSRYEGWMVTPALVLYFLFAARRNRWWMAILVGGIASLGPLSWLAHNWYWFGDPLYFHRGPSSPAAIQGGKPYPGHGDWRLAVLYYRTAAGLCAGPVLPWIAAAGLLAALFRKAFWPLILLVLPGIFYVLSLHSAANPIFVPTLWPHSYYNTRYGMALFPLAVFAAAALVALVPPRAQPWLACALIAAATAPWLLKPSPENWITWKESQVNSDARREWTRQAARALSARYRPGDGVFTSFSDLTGIYRTMGLPLRETLTWDNEPQWLVTTRRPDLFLWEQWAVCMGGDPVQKAINRALRQGPHYELVDKIIVKDAPVVEIYQRSLRHENSVH
jgi:hypothetical protein